MADTNSQFCGNKYNFIQMPSAIFKRTDLDMDAKFLYSYLFTTASLSFTKNNIDAIGIFVYVSFTKLFNWKKELIRSRLKALEDVKLIKIDKPKHPSMRTKVYVSDFDKTPISKYFSPTSIQRFSFLRIPFSLAFDERFNQITSDDMVLYSLYTDLKFLSSKNENYCDDNNAVFVVFSADDAFKSLGWSRSKFYRANKNLIELKLIEVKRSGNGSVNRIYPVDFLFSKKINTSITDSNLVNMDQIDENANSVEEHDEVLLIDNEQMCHIIDSDVSKTDVSKTEDFDVDNELMCQNIDSDVSKTDASKTDVSFSTRITNNMPCFNRLTSNLSKSINLIIERLNSDKFSFDDDKMVISQRLSLEAQLSTDILNALDSLDEDTLFNFIDFQTNFNELYQYYLTALEKCINHEDINVRSNKFEYDIALSTLEGVKAILIGIYIDDPDMIQLLANCKYFPLNVKRNFLKLRANDFELIISRVQSYILNNGEHRTIDNLPAFLLKSMNSHASTIIRKFI